MELSKLKTTLLVASWEFNRFFKWKSFLSGIVTSIIMGGLGFFGTTWLLKDSTKTNQICIINSEKLESANLELTGFAFHAKPTSSIESAIAKMDEDEFDGVLEIINSDSAKIHVPGKRSWTAQLAVYLSSIRRDLKIDQYEVDRNALAQINAEMHLETIITNEGANTGKINGIIAAISIGLVLIAVFMGFSYQFTAITGEKQQRITEQIVSAIEPQTWIDGKILGITGIGLMYVVLFSATGLVGSVLIGQFTGFDYGQIFASLKPLMVISFLIFSLLGILMWNSFMAAIAATVDDPYASDKASLMLLPILPVLFSFFTLMNPDTWAIKFMGIFPLTSYAVLPARMSLTQVGGFEILFALVLLAATAWGFRILAGRIFSLGILMHGKEPTFKEMYYWLRKK